jgi:hypothetical protein
MERVHSSQYFCSGCGAIRNQQTRRCFSCGRVFHDEVDSSETLRALTHPQTKAPYRRPSKLGLFLSELFSFRSIVMIIGLALILWCIITFLPNIVGVKINATVTHIETINCTSDCQMLVTYQYTGANNRVYTGIFHQTLTDTYFHPPLPGGPTPVRYIPALPFIPARSEIAWFPFGVLLAGIFGLGLVVVTAKGYLQ